MFNCSIPQLQLCSLSSRLSNREPRKKKHTESGLPKGSEASPGELTRGRPDVDDGWKVSQAKHSSHAARYGDKVRQIECTSKKEKLSSVARLGWNFCELSFWIIQNLVWKNHWPEIRRHWLFLNRLNSRQRISFFLTSRQNLPLPKSLKWLRKEKKSLF